jgi:tRNA dimethylallyltransferase
LGAQSDMNEKNKGAVTIAITGATATGKTALAIAFASRHGGEIVSCDSMQIYRGMDIGTAKPTRDELALLPHHMIDILDPGEPYSCARYVKEARAIINDIISRGRLPIVCGGTGLYLDALISGNVFSEEPDWSDTNEIRSSLLQYAQEHGAKALHRRLCDVDPEAAASIHPNNIRRVARALEIYLTTGVTKTSWDARSRTGENALPALVIGLRFADRNLHRRIIMKRCEKMFDTGLVDEVRRLYEAGKLATGTASQAIGYKEIIPYILGQSSHKEALASLYTATCQYAKRQETWFRRRDYVHWIDVDDYATGNRPFADLISLAEGICFGNT